jgi:hypothetical protein
MVSGSSCQPCAMRLRKGVETVIRGSVKRPSSSFDFTASEGSRSATMLSLSSLRVRFNIAAVDSDLYNATMSNNSEVLVLANGSSGSVLAAPEPTPQFLLNACCLWCARTFTPRATGGSSRKLLHRTPATVLDRSAPLDDAGDRGGPTLGRLPEGVSHERARCPRQHSGLTDIPE